MIIKKLEVAGLRVFEQAEFDFEPGMNLLVGVNGVGKTTILDALRISLSKILPEFTASRSPKLGFLTSDIRIGSDSMKISCDFSFKGKDFNLLLHEKKDKHVADKPGIVREQAMDTPDIERLTPKISMDHSDIKNPKQQTLGIYFSTRRSLAIDQKPSTASTRVGQAAAFSESLSINRDFNIREIADWMEVQRVIREEDPKAGLHLGALRYAADKFLPHYENLHVVKDDGTNHMMIDKEGIPLSIKQLSDGERGMLCLALDLARRLSLANPGLENPVEEGKGIVLIDELDLHLHPKWQRTVVEQLTKTFPNCQFIATTHSPQIIPTVEPEQVLLIKGKDILRPDRTYGMDSNWILKFIMEADDRPEYSADAIGKVENLIKEGKFSEARAAISDFKENQGFDLPEWSVFEARMSRMEIFGKLK